MRAVIRPATPGDSLTLRAIERRAGERFRAFGLPDVADAEPASVEVLDGYARAGRSWVVVDAGDSPFGYVLVAIVDEQAHIEQISVHPDQQGTGAGRALIEWVAQWARTHERASVTLTTFAAVPWNGPLYAHLGFAPIAESAIGAGLRAVREAETAHGLDSVQRICMRLPLGV